jgi:uncharacterized protein (TIGR04222 family)
MNDEQRRSWRRIVAFVLDEPDAGFPFTARLARENGWSLPFARRVADEYRRFLFLAREAGHPATPSDQVDQAWHLHLLYTESYWDGLCRDVLGRPLHHGPTRGGVQEAAKFHDWYGRTMDSYRRLFGSEPPADIWPPAAERFGRDEHFARINTQTHWVLPRPATLLRAGVGRLRYLAVLAFASMSIVLAGCQAAGMPVPPLLALDLSGMSGHQFLGLFVPLTFGAVAGSVLLRRWLGTREDGIADPEFAEPAEAVAGKDVLKLDPYALILLAQGPTRAAPAQAALVRLVDEGRLTFDEAEKRLSVSPIGAAGQFQLHPVEQAVHDAAQGRRSASAVVQATARSEAVQRVEHRLRAMGWVQSTGHAISMRLFPILLLGAVFLLGFWRIGLGLERGRPVGFLVLLCIVLVIAAVIHLAVKPWRTPRGAGLVDTLRRQKALIVNDPPAPSDARFPLAFALLGLAALSGTGTLAALRQAILPPPSAGGDGCGGGGGGCGGGGCGGGCGGCGGCGG